MTEGIHEGAEGRNPPAKSASTELPIPGTNLTFVVLEVSCVNGKVTIATALIETKTEMVQTGQPPKFITETILEDVYTLALGKGSIPTHAHPEQG